MEKIKPEEKCRRKCLPSKTISANTIRTKGENSFPIFGRNLGIQIIPIMQEVMMK